MIWNVLKFIKMLHWHLSNFILVSAFLNFSSTFGKIANFHDFPDSMGTMYTKLLFQAIHFHSFPSNLFSFKRGYWRSVRPQPSKWMIANTKSTEHNKTTDAILTQLIMPVVEKLVTSYTAWLTWTLTNVFVFRHYISCALTWRKNILIQFCC